MGWSCSLEEKRPQVTVEGHHGVDRYRRGLKEGIPGIARQSTLGDRTVLKAPPVPRWPRACCGPGLTQCWGLRRGWVGWHVNRGLVYFLH